MASGREVSNPNQTANAMTYVSGSETVGAKFHGREGNSPDRQLRPLILDLV